MEQVGVADPLGLNSLSQTGGDMLLADQIAAFYSDLTDPQIVPRATSLAWRGWAAFMTVGLSVVAESVLKRAMASENP